MNLVLIGNFVAARRSDSRATASVTPSTSNRTLAGRITATHDSSGPFQTPIRDLHLNVFQFRNVKFGGFCGAWKYKPRGNYLFEDNEVEKHLSNFPPVDIFITHNSPRLVHDRDDEVHIGFAAFNHYMERARPKFMLHGHQHENIESRIGITRIIGTYGHRMLVVPE